MKPSTNHYSVFAALAAFVFVFIISANAFASVDMFLKIEGVAGEGTYKAPVDPNTGACDFKDVKPGHYKVTLVMNGDALSSRGVRPTSNGAPSSIEISSFSWGVSNSGSMSTGGGLGTGKVSMSSFTVMKRSSGEELPKESLSLDNTATTAPVSGGFTHKQCKLTCRKAGGDQKDFYTITMEDMTIPAIVTNSDGAAAKGGKTGYDVKTCVKI